MVGDDVGAAALLIQQMQHKQHQGSSRAHRQGHPIRQVGDLGG